MTPGRHGPGPGAGRPEPVTAAEVRTTRFTLATFNEGYRPAEVDAFMLRVADELERPVGRSLTSQDVVAQRFRATKFREGYDQGEVDGFLDRVEQAFTALERNPGGGPVPAWGSESAAVPAWGTLDGTARALAEEVRTARFRATTFRPGYDQTEVDVFLDQVVEALRHNGPGPALLSWRDVEDRVFFPTRFREGYHSADVDALLARVVRELRARDDDPQ